jgi:hypothetical protein
MIPTLCSPAIDRAAFDRALTAHDRAFAVTAPDPDSPHHVFLSMRESSLAPEDSNPFLRGDHYQHNRYGCFRRVVPRTWRSAGRDNQRRNAYLISPENMLDWYAEALNEEGERGGFRSNRKSLKAHINSTRVFFIGLGRAWTSDGVSGKEKSAIVNPLGATDTTDDFLARLQSRQDLTEDGRSALSLARPPKAGGNTSITTPETHAYITLLCLKDALEALNALMNNGEIARMRVGGSLGPTNAAGKLWNASLLMFSRIMAMSVTSRVV